MSAKGSGFVFSYIGEFWIFVIGFCSQKLLLVPHQWSWALCAASRGTLAGGWVNSLRLAIGLGIIERLMAMTAQVKAFQTWELNWGKKQCPTECRTGKHAASGDLQFLVSTSGLTLQDPG